MKISLMAAISQNNVIGKDNKLLWKIPEDMRLFKSLTTGHHIIMGRKTFESFNSKPLSNRTNIVISRNLDFEAEGIIPASSYAEALIEAEKNGEDEAFVIGGGEIYKIAMHNADILYISHVHATVDGDTYFPEIDKKVWKLVSKQPFFKDDKNQYDFDFCIYERFNPIVKEDI